MDVPVMGTSLERNNYYHVVVLNSSHQINKHLTCLR